MFIGIEESVSKKLDEESRLVCLDESRTVQSMKDDADINVIVRRFGVTGVVPVSVRVPEYGDFDEVFDFQSAMNLIRQAEAAFMQLPAEVRSKFLNSPKNLVDFVSNPSTTKEDLIEFGLLENVKVKDGNEESAGASGPVG